MRLNIQHYLNNHTLDDLQSELGIKVANHPDLPLVILNYDQIESPKNNPIVKEARGLVLNKNDWSLVARSFPRFFNWGEVPEEMPMFDFSDFTVQSKEDGSLAVVYNFNGDWHINTRGSFALDVMQHQLFSWREGMCRALKIKNLSCLKKKLDPQLSYVCEFVSPWNKIVRNYKEPQMFLITAFCGFDELQPETVDAICCDFFVRPERFNFKSLDEIKSFLDDKQTTDPTFEGVIICDRNFRRWKIKNPGYLSLHKIRGEGDNLYHPRHLLSFILQNEDDELLTYFPEVKDQYFSLKEKIETLFKDLQNVWLKNKDIASQKDFALSIKDQTPFASVLFNVRKKFKNEPTPDDFRSQFVAASSLILQQIQKLKENRL
jgi:hypothetical protein